MRNLIALHRLAREGDGLIAPLLAAMRQRVAIESDPGVVELHNYNPAIPIAAGTPPAPIRSTAPAGPAGVKSRRSRR